MHDGHAGARRLLQVQRQRHNAAQVVGVLLVDEVLHVHGDLQLPRLQAQVQEALVIVEVAAKVLLAVVVQLDEEAAVVAAAKALALLVVRDWRSPRGSVANQHAVLLSVLS